MFNSRVSGILLHPTSLPSRFGIGDLGSAAYQFVDFLAESCQQIWQILPLGPTMEGNSPYSSYSAFAGNPLLISLEKLQQEGLLSEEDFKNLPEFSPKKVEYERVIQTKMPLLKLASDNFKTKGTPAQQLKFQDFCILQSAWLDDYALFIAIKQELKGIHWNQWDEAIAKRQPSAIAQWTKYLSDAIYLQKFLQFQFFTQWQQLKNYANHRGISIFGDISFYVAHDSVDAWANPKLFYLNERGEAELMAGVPPDYFSDTGQLWGNPVYCWEELEKTEFEWWLERVQKNLDYFDLFRIDHFRGFQAFWAVPKGERTAEKGKWMQAPGEAFFEVLKAKLGKLPIVAEDLGIVTPEVKALRDKFNFPGMKVLQFAFNEDGDPEFLPHNYDSPNCIVYTGTHDNNTTVGWFEEQSTAEKTKILNYLGQVYSQANIHWGLIRLAASSVANFAIFPLQDLLGLGSEAKMNTPGKTGGSWSWRYQSEALTVELRDCLKHLTCVYDRTPKTMVESEPKDMKSLQLLK